MKEKLSDFDCYSNYLCEFESQYSLYLDEQNLDDIEPLGPFHLQEKFPFKNPLNYKRVRKQNGFFDYIKDKKDTCIKKENHRMKVIRGHNRAIRSAIANNTPIRTINKLSGSNIFQVTAWKQFKSFVLDNIDHFNTISETKHMPKTDGVSKKTNEEKEMAYKSYNSAFCFEYFSDERTLESFKNYCEFIFHGFGSEELSQRFTYRCCKGKRHTESCRKIWGKLMNFTTNEMILELGISL